MTDALGPKKPLNFCCEKCDFNTCNKKDYSRHLLTAKHKNTYKLLPNTYAENTPNQFVCECGINYKHRQSLYNHKKKCTWGQTSSNNSGTEPQQPTNELVMSLLNQNMELQKQIIDLCKDKNTVIHNNTTNNNNSANNNNNFVPANIAESTFTMAYSATQSAQALTSAVLLIANDRVTSYQISTKPTALSPAAAATTTKTTITTIIPVVPLSTF
jgi:hypothetical protein